MWQKKKQSGREELASLELSWAGRLPPETRDGRIFQLGSISFKRTDVAMNMTEKYLIQQEVRYCEEINTSALGADGLT